MSVTAAEGFAAAGGHCGIKLDDAFDVAVVVADAPAVAAAVFTTSLTAAPVIELGRLHLNEPRLRGIVVASGCANAGTGRPGLEAVVRVAETAAELIGCQVEEVLVATTGSIGPTLPDHLVRRRLPDLISDLAADPVGAEAAARGILTTDNVTKEAVVQAKGYVIGGMSKGSGMVRPNMATMLAYLTTDAVVDPSTLQAALSAAVESTFNELNIDGCQSTNDMVVVLASGASGIEPDPEVFREELTTLCRELVMQMAADAEGGTRVVTINLSGAADDRVARTLGMAVADSALVRSSFYGGDPNWGRILAALGVAGIALSQDTVRVAYRG
ncbi:MAG TPA: bifunctional ornithine acetyltransferase/N-acetylglutamate synthase, partial [Actinobacteria bacterium]|nr:bifunctional ornithine acetyltransferase/N-acetylglutamate synthase [Actinomycetota bacterium]